MMEFLTWVTKLREDRQICMGSPILKKILKGLVAMAMTIEYHFMRNSTSSIFRIGKLPNYFQ